MLIEAVIFDLDGVICRTDQLHFQAWEAVANRLGILAAKAGGFLAAGLGGAIQAPGVDFPLSSLGELCAVCSG